MPITYRLGGEKVRVHVNVDMDTSVKPNYVVEARIRGSEFPDEWVVLGNHRDAWVFGGVDPSSGTASQIELTRALGELLKQGIRPRRTIVMCSWDGEEYALTASTEWGEQFADELGQKAVAYLNVDSSASGPNFEGGAVGSLAPLLVEVSKTLQAPSGKSLYDEWRVSKKKATRGWPTPKHPAAETALVDTRIGSGSDHTVFLNHLGIPSVLLSFEGPYGVYHSMYDNHYWMEHFGDPGFKYHALMSRLWGILALRLANADILPYDFAAYAASIQAFLNDLLKANPKAKWNVIDVTLLAEELKKFDAAGRELNLSMTIALGVEQPNSKTTSQVNKKLLNAERDWLSAEGLPGRPWFKHQLYGTRFTYAHLELPGITEAVESQNWDVARQQVRLITESVTRSIALVKEAQMDLNRNLASRSKP